MLAAEQENTVIRVGYPIQEGLTEYDETTGYSGYTYDYLMEIAQYNGWSYEFVRAGDSGEELVDLMEQLLSGKIDVIGGLSYSETVASMLEFTDESYCTASTVLAALADNAAITRTNFRTFENEKVGTLASYQTINSTLEKDLEKLGMSVEVVTFETEEERKQALESGEISFVVTSSLRDLAEQGWKTIRKFNEKSYYFAVTPGNTEAETAINRVLQSLNTTAYFGQARMEEAHFASGMTLESSWTEEELDYLKSAAPITLLIPPEQAPFYYLDQDETAHGIGQDLANKLTEITGLRFSVQTAEVKEDGSNNYLELIQKGKVDATLGLSMDWMKQQSDTLMISHPFMECSMALVTNPSKADNVPEGKPVAAVSEETDVDGIAALENYEIQRYRSAEECLQALNRGEVQVVYGNAYVLQFYIQHDGYNRLQVQKLDEPITALSFGLTYPADPILMSILNKGISQLKAGDLQEIVYENLVDIPKKLSLRSLVEQYPWQFLIGLCVAAAVLILILLLIIRTHRRTAKRAVYEKQWYDSLAKVCNEYLFEYNYQSDQIRFSEELAKVLHLPRTKKRWQSYFKAHPELFGASGEEILTMLSKKKDVAGYEFEWIKPDGSRAWHRLTQTVVRDGKRAVRLIGKFANVQNEYTEKDQLVRRAERDSLTGVYNSEACNVKVSDLAGEHRGAAIVIDVDHFKEINDTFGHAAGDHVLRALAESMLKVFREQDIIGRLGGDEFLVFMEDVSSRETVAERCEMLAGEFIRRTKQANQEMATTLSVGIYMAQTDEPFETIYVKADKALYESKRLGRNCYTFYHE